MSRYSLTTLTDSALLRDLKTLVSQERSTMALHIAPLAPPAGDLQLAPERVNFSPTEQVAPGPAEMPAPRSEAAPLAPQRFAVQFTMDEEAYADLLYAQALLGHSVPPGDLAQVLDRALDVLIAELEQQEFVKTDKPRLR